MLSVDSWIPDAFGNLAHVPFPDVPFALHNAVGL